MTRLRRRRLQALGLRAQRGLRRHYVSLISVTVLAVAATQALTAPGFENEPSSTSTVSEAAFAPAAVPSMSAPATIATVTERLELRARQRRLALVYLVMNEAEGKQIVQTYRTLIWDMPAPEAMRPVTVQYLIADTIEAEAAAVQLLNALAGFVSQQEVDLRVIDVRPGRRPANTGAP